MKSIKKNKDKLYFHNLVNAIKNINTKFSNQAKQAVNISLTLRNWMFGFYISEYELHGNDRAKYGLNLLVKLSSELKKLGISNCGKRQLYYYLQFFQIYPQIVGAMTAQLPSLELFKATKNLKKVRSVTALSQIDPQRLLNELSYTHFEQLLRIDDDIKRIFYEIEAIQGNWSVRELKRQINSLYYERSGLSRNKEKLSKLANKNIEKSDSSPIIRDPYIFEFLGLKSKEVMSESHLEDELLDKIQEFLLELGHGICFEARQKRILIGKTHYFIDLVLYHRILKCHILVELKLADFSHENIGQLNTYVNWYKKNVMAENDNPPIGILLCTNKDHSLVEYALAGMDDNLFVSKYQLELPKKEEMRKFIEKKLKDVKK